MVQWQCTISCLVMFVFPSERSDYSYGGCSGLAHERNSHRNVLPITLLLSEKLSKKDKLSL